MQVSNNLSRIRRSFHHLHHAGVLRARFDHKLPGPCKALQVSFFLKSDRAGAGELRLNIAIDKSATGVDLTLKLDLYAALHAQLAAGDVADDLAMAADAQLAGALHRSGQLPEYVEIVALQIDPDDGTAFQNCNITACLYALTPVRVHFVIAQADVAATLWALARLRVSHHLENITAVKAVNRALAGFTLKYFSQKTDTLPLRGLGSRLAAARRGMLERWITGGGQPRSVLGADNGFAVADVHVETAGAAQGRYHHSRFELAMLTLRANKFYTFRVRFNCHYHEYLLLKKTCAAGHFDTSSG